MRIILFCITLCLFYSCNKNGDHVCNGCNLTVSPFPDLAYDTTGVKGIFILQKKADDFYPYFNAFAFFSNYKDLPNNAVFKIDELPMQFKKAYNYYSVGGTTVFQGTYNDTLANWKWVNDSFADNNRQPYFNTSALPDTMIIRNPAYIKLDSLIYADSIQLTIGSKYYYYTGNTDSLLIDSSSAAAFYNQLCFITVSATNHKIATVSANKYLFVKQFYYSKYIYIK